ncbi:distal tail protein Dit [Enterococcus dispar]
MSLSVKVNGVELNKYLKVTDLRRGIGPTRSNSLQKLGMTHGEHYLGYSKGAKVYEMDFVLRYDLISKRRTLAGILDVTEPVQVIFGDEPDKYVLAVPEGDIDVAEKNFLGFGTIKWVIPEGYAHSVSESINTATPNADGILSMQIVNKGTETAELSFEATMTSDNGFLGAVGPLGAMEFGNIAEVDGFNDNDEMAFRDWFTPTSESKWTKNNGVIDWKISHGGNPNLQQGAFSWKNEWAEATNFGTTQTDNRWYGPSISRIIPPKKSTGTRDGNWKLRYWVQHKSQGNAKKLGRQELNISALGNSIVTFVIYDDANTSNKTTFEIRLQGIVKKRFYADADLLEFYGSIDIWKEDNTIYFKIYSKDTGKILTYSIYDEEVAAAPVDKITYWCSKYYSNQVCLMSINFMDFWWASKGFVDTANRWTTDDVLKYNGTTGKFYVNDVLSMGDIIQGSTDLKIPPGVWTVEFYYSDFGKTPPNIVGTLRERWL